MESFDSETLQNCDTSITAHTQQQLLNFTNMRATVASGRPSHPFQKFNYSGINIKKIVNINVRKKGLNMPNLQEKH